MVNLDRDSPVLTDGGGLKLGLNRLGLVERQGFPRPRRRGRIETISIRRLRRMPRIPPSSPIRSLIRRVPQKNSTWGSPWIQSELALLGYTVDQSTAAWYMCRHRKPPSQTWRTFLKNHVRDTAAISSSWRPCGYSHSTASSSFDMVGGVSSVSTSRPT